MFNSSLGRYRFGISILVFPFGISCASEVAQEMVEKHFGDISGALPIFDETIIVCKDEQEHDSILRKVLTRPRKNVCHLRQALPVVQTRPAKVVGYGGWLWLFCTVYPKHVKINCLIAIST